MHSALRPGPLRVEDEHLYELIKDLPPEKRLELALDLMELTWELKRAGETLSSKKNLKNSACKVPSSHF